MLGDHTHEQARTAANPATAKALERRVESLKSEQTRKRESLPIKALSWASLALSLFAVGLKVGFRSLAFVLPSIGVAVVTSVAAVGHGGTGQLVFEKVTATPCGRLWLSTGQATNSHRIATMIRTSHRSDAKVATMGTEMAVVSSHDFDLTDLTLE